MKVRIKSQPEWDRQTFYTGPSPYTTSNNEFLSGAQSGPLKTMKISMKIAIRKKLVFQTIISVQVPRGA